MCLAKPLAFLALLLTLLSAAAPARAQDGESLSFIRDAEIENYLRALATPIYRAADIDPKRVSIFIVHSSAINAFVAEGMNEFFYTGLLMQSDSPEQLAGVIAHETGHITGGHLIRGKEEMKNASAQAILGMLAAIAAGAAAGSGDLMMGGIAGTSQIAQRSFLSYSRSQEASADAAGMSFLDRAGITTRGLYEFFKKLSGQELLPTGRQDEYVRTHPLTQDRVDAVHRHLEASSHRDDNLPQKFDVMHERMKAKLLGYLQPETALLRYTDNDPRIGARYARAIALYRTGHGDRALTVMDSLIKEEPHNPYFYEQKAQILFDNARIEESIAAYKRANDLLPDSSLLRLAYGRALLESKDTSRLDLAIQNLQESNRLEERTPETWRALAAAWGRKAESTGDQRLAAMATYALAEESAALGRDKVAGQYATRAMKGLPKGSAYWLRAQDIKLSTTPDDDKAKDRKRQPD